MPKSYEEKTAATKPAIVAMPDKPKPKSIFLCITRNKNLAPASVLATPNFRKSRHAYSKLLTSNLGKLRS